MQMYMCRMDIHNQCHQARQTRPNSGGGCRGPSKIRQRGGGCNNFLLLRVKIRTFWSFYAKRLKKAKPLRILRYKKVPF